MPEWLYLVKLQELVDEAVGVVPWAREIARKLSVGQDWARQLIALLNSES